jgi:two-component system sensor histidine kinase HydH
MARMHRWQLMRRYVRFDASDEEALRASAPLVRPHFPAIVDLFYERIFENEAAARVFTGGEEQIERQKCALREWLESCFTGPWDGTYFEKRAKIGRVHVWIGLEPRYMVLAMDLIRRGLQEAIEHAPSLLPAGRSGALGAIHKICDLDLAIMLETYREEFEAQLKRRERLSTFGQLMASIGHELRNPLGVIASSLFLVRSRAPKDDAIVRHLDRIAEQVALSNKIIAGFLDLVREQPRNPARVPAGDAIAGAVAAVAWPPEVHCRLEVAEALPDLEVDPDQARHVLTNLLANAIEAVGAAGEVRVSAQADGAEVAIVVSDTGPGIAPSVRARLFEPLVTTRSRGTGLGLALARRLVEANHGSIRLTSGPLPGAAFEVRFPTARAALEANPDR